MSAPPPDQTPGTLMRLHAPECATARGRWSSEGWSLCTGETWFMLGGAGAGKTALLRALSGLEPLRTGRIEFDGADWSSLAEATSLDFRRRIGLVLPHEAGLLHQTTVSENVLLPLRYHRSGHAEEFAARCRDLLEALDLVHLAATPSVLLPLGAARRTLLARALALDPDLLLLDDVTGELDELERRSLIRRLRAIAAARLQRTGRPLTIVITGRSATDWRHFPGMKWALLREGTLQVDLRWEQLVATAPELFQHPDGEPTTA